MLVHTSVSNGGNHEALLFENQIWNSNRRSDRRSLPVEISVLLPNPLTIELVDVTYATYSPDIY